MGRAMEDMTNCTHRKFKANRVSPTFQSLFLFVTSIARTNLESEIVQRDGSLVTQNNIRYKPKRDCIGKKILQMFLEMFLILISIILVPLLHVLSVHVRVLREWPVWKTWANLCGLPVNDGAPVPSLCTDLISLLADPCALLLKFILLAPLHLDLGNFKSIIK